MFEKISKKLKSLLQASNLVQAIYDYEASNLKGLPAISITPSANENDYHSTTENARTYGFVIRLYAERTVGEAGELAGDKTLRELADAVLNTLDNNHQLAGLETQTGYTFLFMEAAPSLWGYAGRENTLRVAEIRMRVHFHVDVNVVT